MTNQIKDINIHATHSHVSIQQSTPDPIQTYVRSPQPKPIYLRYKDLLSQSPPEEHAELIKQYVAEIDYLFHISPILYREYLNLLL